MKRRGFGSLEFDGDEKMIRQAIAKLIPDGNVFEIRVIQNGSKKPITGYFKTADALLDAIRTVDVRRANIYITLQELTDACYSRVQSDSFVANALATSDADVTRYRWLFIDVDPERASGVSASNDELALARATANNVYKYMREIGFSNPLMGYSGNGCHLLYRVDIPKTDDNVHLMSDCLMTLNMLFGDDKVKIDVVNFNPSRVCKLYGTVAKKGKNSDERPWRMSALRNPDADIQVNDMAMLQKLSAQMPQAEQVKSAQYNNYSPGDFDVEQWLDKHHIEYNKKPYKGGVKYVLAECPFDHSHAAPDSAVFKMDSGALGFKCLHNSCAGKTWQDMRVMFEPTAYEQKQTGVDNHIELGIEVFNRNRDKRKAASEQVKTEAVAKPMFLTMADVDAMPDQEIEYVKTGITWIDTKMGGLGKKGISVFTGLRGASKSTLLNQVALNAVEQGCNVVVYSGELSPQNFWRWLAVQAAGRQHMMPSRRFSDFWVIDSPTTKDKIKQWTGKRLWLYNNECGNNFRAMADSIRAACLEKKADLVIIDNLMALDLADMGSDKYESQTNFVQKLKKLAQETNTHVCFVAHPRKATGLLRLDDIAGSGNIANIVDTAIIIHRNNDDFKRLTHDTFHWPADDKRYQSTNVLEICKDREHGTQDEWINLYFDGRDRRLRNSVDEYVHYGWEKIGEQQKLFDHGGIKE